MSDPTGSPRSGLRSQPSVGALSSDSLVANDARRSADDRGIDILVGHALFMALDPKQAGKAMPYPPLGTLYAAGHLRTLGYRVAVYDAMLEPDETTFREALRIHRPRMVALVEDSFNFYSKMCLARMREAALGMVADASAQGIPVVVAGSDATDAPADFLRAGAGAVMLGEAEHTVAELAERLLGDDSGSRSASSLGDIAGLALAGADGTVQRTPQRAPERRPDVFGLPARDLVDVDAYRALWRDAHGEWSLNIVSTRGCPFHCNWCAKPIWGQRYAMREPEAVADEIAALAASCAPDHLWFADDIFGLREQWVASFGAAMVRHDVRVPFTVQTRVDLMSESAVAGLATAGCRQAWLGVESGSQTVVDRMDKGIQVADIGPVTQRLRAQGIRVAYFLQLGYPGETWTDIEATADLIRAHVPDEIGVSVSYPLPGTPFYDRVARELGPKRHWHDSDELAMLFRGRYGSPFYRRIHTALHGLLDAYQAAQSAESGESDIGDAPVQPNGSAKRRSSNAQRAGAAHVTLAAAEAVWESLAADERASRRDAPTLLPTVASPPAPRLDGRAN